MSDPILSGNRAEETAEFENGADFTAINMSAGPLSVEPIEAQVEVSGRDLTIIPTRITPSMARGVGELRESAKDILAAQLFEDPESMTPYTQEKIEKAKSSRGSLIFYAIRPNVGAACAGDRVLIKRDTLESTYSCTYCHGKGHSEEICPTCKGEAVEKTNGIASPCRSCKVLGYDREEPYCSGRTPCEYCRASGWKGGIVIPDAAKSEPFLGIIVSVGPQTKDSCIGDRVIFSKYAGHTHTTPEGDSFTIMHEHEWLMLLKDLNRNGNS